MKLCRLLLLLLLGSIAMAGAAEPSLHVEAAWARATPGASTVGVVYLTIVNAGASADRLVALSSPVAERAEMHINIQDGNVMQMRPVSAVDLKPGDRVVFKPTGLHIMLVALHRPLKRGEHVPVMLTFEKAGTIETEAVILPVGAQSYSPQ
jgi:copper(I)-binding protein